MTPVQALAVLAVSLFRGSSNKLTMKTVQAWINEHSRRDTYGRGYTGNTLSRGPSNGYVEVTRQSRQSGTSNISAAVYFDPRQGPVASKTWQSVKLDSSLEKHFGKNLRVRIDV